MHPGNWIWLLVMASCAAPKPAEPEVKGPASSVAEFLAAVRTRGAGLVCNAQLVEGILGARIGPPKVTRGELYRADFDLTPAGVSLIREGGEYTQFRSSATGLCQIKINIPDGALCDIHSDKYHAVVGARAVPYTPPHPPRSRTPDQVAFHLFGEGEPAQRDEVWFSTRYDERCVYQVIIRTRGKFQEIAAPSTADNCVGKRLSADAGQGPAFDAIREYLTYPEASCLAGREGRVVVRFWMSKSGEIQQAEIRQSSGDMLLDREVLRAVTSLNGTGKLMPTAASEVTVTFRLPR